MVVWRYLVIYPELRLAEKEIKTFFKQYGLSIVATIDLLTVDFLHILFDLKCKVWQ